jgi:hypothetical protein
MHEGRWSLRVRNVGQQSDTVKVVVLANSGIRLRVNGRTQGGGALLTASLIEGDELLRVGVRIIAEVRPNRPSTSDSEKQDGITGGDRPIVGITIPGGNEGIVVVPTVGQRAPQDEVAPAPDTALVASVSPEILRALEERARLLQLGPELLGQLRGHFIPNPSPTGIELRDDGTLGDAQASDGVYSVLLSLPVAGLYQVRAMASQARPEGTLTREALTSILAQ